MRSKSFLGIFLILSIALIGFLPARLTAPRVREAAGSADSNSPRLVAATGGTVRFGKASAAASARTPKIALPIRFEPAAGSAGHGAQFVGRGGGTTVLLTDDGMKFVKPARGGVSKNVRAITMEFSSVGESRAAARKRKTLDWKGASRLGGETNYFLGNDPARWRKHVPQFARAMARAAVPGVDVVTYGNDDRLEYDLRVAPGTKPADLRLAFRGARGIAIDARGDLVLRSNGGEIRMHKPAIYQRGGAADDDSTIDREVDGGYLLEADGTVGFRVGAYNSRETLVIDPSLSVGYATFLGGAGDDSAASIALDASGKIYIGGTTTSASFVEAAGASLGEVGGGSDYFIAKIDPSQAGPNSLVYLTFIGGSAAETGGEIAVDGAGNVALLGTTTSPDYPVTDGSARTTGLGGVAVNDATITEIDPSGANLVYSTLFGGNGNEATVANGGIAFDASGNIFVAMDTQSTNLTTAPTAAPGPFQEIYGGGASDGFFAIFRPVVTAPTTHLKYCTYLGIDAQATLTSVAVDSVGNAYLAGYTSDPLGTLVVTNGFQPTFGGGTYNGFVMKILPSGTGIEDLSYGTFLGGDATDEILAIAVNSNPLPGTVYVTGSASSPNFPVNGTVAPFQATLRGINGNSNAFLAVIGQLASGVTKLVYSSYLGGSQSDVGLGIFFAAANQVYIAGSAKSWDFPWAYNFQPFTGDQVAFVAEMDPTTAGAAALLYATPLGGTAAAGASATAAASGIAVGPAGNFYVAGATVAGDFPVAGAPGNGFQLTCASCQQNPPLGDAFVVEGVPGGAATPSVSFNVGKVNFGTQTVGAATIPQAVGVINTGGAPLTISAVNITGANAGDFSLIGPAGCTAGPIAPDQKCSFEVGFVGSMVGPEEAYVTVTDNTPATSQSLAVVGAGSGPFAVVSPGTVNFGDEPINTKTFMEIILTNSGNLPLSFTQIISGPNSSQFVPSTQGLNTCPSASAAVLAPAASCTVGFYFAPTTTGTLTAEVVFVDNSGGVAGAQQVVPIMGVGTGAAPVLVVSPNALNFGSQNVGMTSATQLVTFSNNGSSDLNISGFAITGASSTSFGYVAKGANACTLPTAQLAAGASCTLSVDFIPTAAGPVAAALAITDNAQGSPQMVPLSGNGGTTGISISPASFSFAPESVGISSAPVTANIKNTGTSPLTMTLSVAGSDPGDFSETDNCSQSPLGAGQTCIVNLTFAPKQTGSRSAVVQLSDNAPQNPQTIPLSGTAVQATAAISPATSLPFAPQLAGTASTPQNVTVTNSGSGAAILMVSSATLTPPGDFTLANNCKSGVAAGLNCIIGVTFTPPVAAVSSACGSTAGAQSSVLKVFDNDPASPQTLNVSGTVTDYCLIPPGAISATVTAGGTAQFQLDAQATGYTGTITLTCAATITQGACSVTPASVTFTGNAAVPFQVSVTTVANAASATLAAPRAPANFRLALQTSLALILIWFSVVVLGGGGAAPRSHVARSLRVAQTFALFVVFSLTLVACFGGSSSSAVGPGGTPAGTYPITVTGTTSTGVTRAIGLTLTVQ